jgi:hypothetical protein
MRDLDAGPFLFKDRRCDCVDMVIAGLCSDDETVVVSRPVRTQTIEEQAEDPRCISCGHVSPKPVMEFLVPFAWNDSLHDRFVRTGADAVRSYFLRAVSEATEADELVAGSVPRRLDVFARPPRKRALRRIEDLLPPLVLAGSFAGGSSGCFIRIVESEMSALEE